MIRWKDQIGEKFGQLITLEYKFDKRPLMLCRCDCGKEKWVFVGDLKSGKSKSCGSCGHIKHGMSRSKEYITYYGILQRCNEENSDRHFNRNYSGRGIKVCSCIDTFEKFFVAVGKCPNDKDEIDRKDNDGNYCVCTNELNWVTRSVNNLNKRKKENATSKYRGVYKMSESRYKASMKFEGKTIFIGYHPTELVAYEAYKNKYYELRGNYPPEY